MYWIIASAAFSIAILSFAAPHIIRDFERQSAYLGLFKEAPPEVPIDCNMARGTEYRMEGVLGWCWYELTTFRRLYPEYQSSSDVQLANRLYMLASTAGAPPIPWTALTITILVAIGIPLIVLGGWFLFNLVIDIADRQWAAKRARVRHHRTFGEH